MQIDRSPFSQLASERAMHIVMATIIIIVVSGPGPT